MENIHHVHEVLQMLAFSNQEFTRESLVTEIETTFGKDVLFANCADINFNAEEIIDFMKSKNKVEEKEGKIRLVSQPCDH